MRKLFTNYIPRETSNIAREITEITNIELIDREITIAVPSELALGLSNLDNQIKSELLEWKLLKNGDDKAKKRI